MKAIITKYLGPTDTKGSRIKADDGDGNTITISYPHELSGEDVHRKAAEALCDKMGWTGELIGGAIKNGYAFVFSDPAPIRACEAVLVWAKTPGNHGGNPYTKEFVELARKALGKEDL